jgi:hypothetical protein
MKTKSSIHCDKCKYKEELDPGQDNPYDNWTLREINGIVEHYCWQCAIKPEED